MAAGSTEALYTIKVSTETTAVDKLSKDVDALKNQPSIPIKLDAALATQSVEELKRQTAAIAQEAQIHLGVDSTQATKAIGAIGDEAKHLSKSAGAIHVSANTTQASEAIGALAKKEKTIGDEKIKIEADTSGATSKIDGLKEKEKSMHSGIGGASHVMEIAGIGAAVEGIKMLGEKAQEAIGYARQMETAYGSGAGLVQAKKDAEELGTQFGITGEHAGIAMAKIRAATAGTGATQAQVIQFTQAYIAAQESGLQISVRSLMTEKGRQNMLAQGGPLIAQAMASAKDPMTQAQLGMKNLELTAGDLAASALGSLAPAITLVSSGLKWMADFAEKNKTVVLLLAGAVGSYLVVTKSMELYDIVAASAKALLGTATVASTAATEGATVATEGLNVAMTANPIGLVIAAIAALAVGFYELYQHCTPVRNIINDVWGVLKGLGAFIDSFVSTEIASLIKAFEGVGSVIHGIVTMNFDEVKKGVGQVTDAVGTGMTGASAGVAAFKKSVNDSSDALDKQSGKATDAGDAATNAANSAAAAQKSLADAISGANTAFTAQGKAATNTLSTEKTEYERQAQYIATGYANGIKLTQSQLEAYKQSNKELFAQGSELRSQQKEIAAEGDAFMGKTPASHHAHAAARKKDILSVAEAQAAADSKKFEDALRYQLAMKGIKFSAEDELAVDENKLKNLDQQIAAVGKLSAAQKAKAAEDIQNAGTKVNVTSNGISDTASAAATKAAGAAAKHQEQITQELAAAQVAIMADGADKQIAIEKAKFNKENKDALDQMAAGKKLSKDEALLLMDREVKYQQDVLAIKKQYATKGANEDVAIKKATIKTLEAIETDFLAKKASMSKADIDAKNLSFQEQNQKLNQSLAQGQITHQEYNVKLEQLNQSRQKFEESQENQKWKAITGLATNAFKSLTASGEKWLATRVEQMLFEKSAFITSDEGKTAAAAVGSAARIATSAAEGVASLAVAGANMVAGVATEIWEAVSSLGPIAGPIVGLASAGIIYEGYRGLKSALGFATGGIGLVGEKGPEVISPVKDFSNFASGLTTNVAKEVRRAMSDGDGDHSGSRKGPSKLAVTGSLVSRGRDLNYSITRDTIQKKTERLLPQ